MEIGLVLIAGAVGYLLGSVPFGFLLTKMVGAGDVREIGSGNIGATNVLRTGRKGLAAATLLLDALKGALAVLAVLAIFALYAPAPFTLSSVERETIALTSIWAASVAAVAAMLGHCFPVWLRFKGGKGVATFLGLEAVLFPIGALVFAVIWLGSAYFTRYSSLAALLAVGSAPVVAFILGSTIVALVLLAMAAIVYYRHSENIARLSNGTERRIGGPA